MEDALVVVSTREGGLCWQIGSIRWRKTRLEPRPERFVPIDIDSFGLGVLLLDLGQLEPLVG